MISLIVFIAYAFAAFAFVEVFIFFDGPLHILHYIRQGLKGIHPQVAELTQCPMCLSHWVGFSFSILNYFFIPYPITPFNMAIGGIGPWWVVAVLDMFFTAGTTWILYNLDEYLEKES